MHAMQQKKIKEYVLGGHISDFTVNQNANQRWEIEFTYRGTKGYKLEARRGQVREFTRLNGIYKWMLNIGVKEFKVLL